MHAIIIGRGYPTFEIKSGLVSTEVPVLPSKQLNQQVTRTYQVGMRFEGNSGKERRTNELKVARIVRNYQHELYHKITPKRVEIALKYVKENPELTGVQGVARLRPLLNDCSNLGEAAYLPLLEAVKGTIIRQKILQKAFEIQTQVPTTMVEWWVFGRSPYLEGQLQRIFKYTHKYTSNLLLGARRKADQYLPKKDRLQAPLPELTITQLVTTIQTFYQQIQQEFQMIAESAALSKNQKRFLTKLEHLAEHPRILAAKYYHWLQEWNQPLSTTPKSRWKFFNRFCREIADWLQQQGYKRVTPYTYRSVLRGILVTALLPFYDHGKAVVNHLETGTFTSDKLISKPFSKKKLSHQQKLPIHLLMGNKYVIARPGNARVMTELTRETGQLELSFWPYRQRKKSTQGVIIFHQKLLRFLQHGAEIKSLSVIARNAPSHKVVVYVVLTGKYTVFLSRAAIEHRCKTIVADLPTITASSIGIDINRLGEHMVTYSEDISIPESLLKLVNRYHHLETVISELSGALEVRKRTYKRYSSLSRHLKWLKVKGELDRVYARRSRLLKEIHKQCRLLTVSVLISLSCDYLCVEELRLTAKGTRGALAKAILSLPDELDLFERVVLVSEWITGKSVTLVRVDPRGTSQSFHHGCPASPPGKLLRDRTNWDYALCSSCGALINCHKNASYHICALGTPVLEVSA